MVDNGTNPDTLSLESQTAMRELEELHAIASELLSVATSAAESEVDGIVGTLNGLYETVNSGVATTLGDVAETLGGLEQEIASANGFAEEIATMADSSGSETMPADETNEQYIRRVFPQIHEGTYTPKQLLWTQWALYVACVRNNRFYKTANPEGECVDFLNRARNLEIFMGLTPHSSVVPPGPPRSVSIEIPYDSDIRLILPDGRVI